MKKNKSPKLTEPENYEKFDASSSTECTGLITVPPQDEDELENYKDIYEFEVTIDEK